MAMALPVSMCVTEFWAKTTSSNCWRPDHAASRPMQQRKFISVWNPPTRRKMDRGTQSGGSLSTTSVAFLRRAGQRWELVWLHSEVPAMGVEICSSCWLGPYLSWVGKERTVTRIYPVANTLHHLRPAWIRAGIPSKECRVSCFYPQQWSSAAPPRRPTADRRRKHQNNV